MGGAVQTLGVETSHPRTASEMNLPEHLQLIGGGGGGGGGGVSHSAAVSHFGVQQGACARGRWAWPMRADSSGGIRSLDQIRSVSFSPLQSFSVLLYIFICLFIFSHFLP